MSSILRDLSLFSASLSFDDMTSWQDCLGSYLFPLPGTINVHGDVRQYITSSIVKQDFKAGMADPAIY